MAGSIQQTYNERTGAEINPVTESNAVEWTPNRAFNLTQIIQTIQQNASNLTVRVDDLEKDVATNTANIATNAANIANNTRDIATKAADNAVVKLAGAQTISGVKTFSTIPQIPTTTPTANKDVVSKFFYDQTGVKLTGNQTIAGIKTFSSIPVLPASDPTTTNQATRKAYVDARDALKQDKLIAGPNITIGPDGKTISAPDPGGIPQRIVLISDFETFNPSANLVDIDTKETFTLREGESCGFRASYDANGKPSIDGDSMLASDPLKSIFYWSGTVTRISGTYYMVTALGANTTSLRPQTATRIYYGSNRYGWVIGTDYGTRQQNGYVKLPSGLMIQWGYSGGTDYERTITFPVAFKNVYSVTLGQWRLDTGAVFVAELTNIENSKFRYIGMGVNKDWWASTLVNAYWMAIGSYK